jgi:transposase
MRRTHLRGHANILKRLLIHASGFNLGLVMRCLLRVGTPRGLQGRAAAALATLAVLMHAIRRQLDARTVRTPGSILRHARMLDSTSELLAVTRTTGC